MHTIVHLDRFACNPLLVGIIQARRGGCHMKSVHLTCELVLRIWRALNVQFRVNWRMEDALGLMVWVRGRRRVHSVVIGGMIVVRTREDGMRSGEKA